MSGLDSRDLQAYFSISRIGFWRVDMRDGVAVKMYADATMQELIGAEPDLTPTELAQFFEARVEPADAEILHTYGRDMQAGNAEVIYRYNHPANGQMYIRCSGRKVRTEDGLDVMVGQHQEISDLMRLEPDKLMENRLVRSNRDLRKARLRQDDYYRELLDMAGCGVMAYTLTNHKMLHMNAEALRIYGVDSLEDAQAHLAEILREVEYPDPGSIDALRSLRNGDGTVDYECIIPDRKGHKTYTLARTEVFNTPSDGRAVVTTFLDISENHVLRTEKASLEKAVDNLTRNYEVIGAISKIFWQIYSIDLVHDHCSGVMHHDKDGANQAKYFEGSATESFQYAIMHYILETHKPQMQEFLDFSTLPARLAERETIGCEYMSIDGNWFRARFIVQKRDEHGRVTDVLFTLTSINIQKQAELEHQRQLRDAAEEARRANIAKTDFLRRMSHDIRTPINGIMGMLSIADHYADDVEKQAECRAKVREASGFLLDLINNVLDMNKLESGNVQLEHKPFDLPALLHEIENLVDMQRQNHPFRLYVDNGEFLHPHLVGSPLHLRQVFQNLTGNAVKYNRPGGSITLSCRELRCENNKATYRFSCADTGIGMSEEFQRHAFEPFSQEGAIARSTYTGTGLGLAITKQIVDLMGGTLTMQSEQGVGTTFTLEITLDVDTDYVQPAAPQDELQATTLSGVHVLLAEDNVLNTEIAKFQLENAQAQVTAVTNGREAVAAFRSAPPGTYDVILMDVMMPVMDGLAATRQIRLSARPDGKTIPIFAMTANAFQDDVRQSHAAGMNEHFSKPLNPELLVRTIAQYVAKAKQK